MVGKERGCGGPRGSVADQTEVEECGMQLLMQKESHQGKAKWAVDQKQEVLAAMEVLASMTAQDPQPCCLLCSSGHYFLREL